MTEVEAFSAVDRVSHPFAEIAIVELSAPIFLRAFVLHDLRQVLEVDLHVGSVRRHKVLRSEEAILIRL